MIIAKIAAKKEKLLEYGIDNPNVHIGRNVFLYVHSLHKMWGWGYYFGEIIPQREMETKRIIDNCFWLPEDCFKDITVIRNKLYRFSLR